MPLKNIIITSSINSLPTLSYGQKTYISSTDYESFPIETIIGGNGGVMPNLHGNISSSNLFININQSWSGSINTPVGIVDFVDDTQNEFINGQFSGSTILVSDGELSEDNPFTKVSNIITNYTPVYYYDIKEPLQIYPFTINNAIPFSVFQNPKTIPSPGEILIGGTVRAYTIFPSSITFKPLAVKISIFDNDGNNNIYALKVLESFYINNQIYNIDEIVDHSTEEYIYYKVSIGEITTKPHGGGRILNYEVSASNPSSFSTILLPPGGYLNFPNIAYNSLGYFTSSGIYTFHNTPNTILNFTCSFNASGTTPAGIVAFTSYPIPNNTNDWFSSSVFYISPSGPSGTNVIFTGSIPPSPSDSYFSFSIFPFLSTINFTVSNLNLEINQYQNSSVGSSSLTVFSPYLQQDFFYNDWNALYGNNDGLEYDKDFMKVIYETGQSIPTNQEEILSGSAEKAPVKPYNYALKAQTLPRYEGVRTESPNFNATSSIGIGGVSNVESLKIVAAYCDSIGGWPPEKMNSSAIHIKYLIDENGDIITPNTTENSLFTNKYSFISGERVLIKSNNESSGNPNPYRTIFRGGTRIEPILYTQVGVAPTNTWASQIELIDIVGTSGGVIADVRAVAGGAYGYGELPYPTQQPNFTPVLLRTYTQFSGKPNVMVNNGGNGKIYTVTNDIFTDNLNITFNLVQYNFGIRITSPQWSPYPVMYHKVVLRHDRLVGGNYTFYKDYPTFDQAPSRYVTTNVGDASGGSPQIRSWMYPGNITKTFTPAELQPGDRLYAVIFYARPSDSGVSVEIQHIDSILVQITQTPVPTSPIFVGVTSSAIWGYPDPINYPNVITSSNSTLTSLYNEPNIRMVDLTGSNFNPIVLPWSIKRADEFRFEGVENETYLVSKVFGPNDGLTSPYTASLNLSNIVIKTYSVGSSSFSLNGITFYYTGSDVANTSNFIYINTSSFNNSLLNDYVTTSSIIFNYSSSEDLYSASLQYINTNESSPYINFIYGGTSNTLPVLISGSTTIPFGGGSQIRVSPQGSIEVHFNKNLNPSASISSFNLDHFLIRRYIDDAAQIIIDGFAPIGSGAPYVVTPEFITPKLSKNIDKYITDLTQKGLL